VVAITRKVIINDDMQAFTRIPQLLGQAAATLESNTVWSLITANGAMSDGNTVFHANHANLNTGAGSALGTTGLAAARAAMRLQTAPKGMPLNLTPRYVLVPAALENTVDQLVSPINIASSDFTKVVPTWIRSLQPIVEPRLDGNSTSAWYLIADPAMIDTVEYCYLEGQQGVYTETRQGFDVDGLEIKARLDFAAAFTEYRGVQKNAGA
jgi:phage major head subunit gpT-like protein